MESIVLERIAELWKYRQWYRDHLGWIPAQRTENMAELRYLVALARKTRRDSRVRIAIEGPDHPADATWVSA